MLKSIENYENALQKLQIKKTKIMGLNFLSDDYKVLNRNLVGITLTNIIIFITSSFYSFKIYAGDMEKTVFCLVSFGFVIKATVKIKAFILNREKFKEIVHKIKGFHTIAASHDYQEIFMKYSRVCDIVMKFIDILFGFVATSTLLNPILIKILTNELVLPFGFELPFSDPTTTSGYAINYIFTLQIAYWAYLGFSAAESYNAVSIIPVFGAFDLLFKMIVDLKKFNNEKDDEEMKERKNLLHEIIKTHQDLLDLIDELENFYKSTNFICLGAIVIQCVASLFALITIGWYVGFVIVMMCIAEIFMMCIFGALLGIMKEKFREKIGEIDWVGKDRVECKTIVYMLHSTEDASTFTYVVGPLNFETFMMVRSF